LPDLNNITGSPNIRVGSQLAFMHTTIALRIDFGKRRHQPDPKPSKNV
jgi:hypothetical protein